jgi:integrase
MKFLEYQKKRSARGEILPTTIPNYYKAAKLFCVMNDIVLNWQKIARGVPYQNRAAADRPPSRDEIMKLLDYPDKRIKPIILTMISSGIRLGSWDEMKWKHIEPMEDSEGNIIAAKLVVYPGDKEEYYTFLTPEAYNALMEWMDYRRTHGETICGDSWVMRDIWQTSERSYGAYFGLAENPRQLKSLGIKSLIERAIHSQGLWKPLSEGNRRREWKGVHGFRKFFKTQTELVMKSINVEVCIGHNIGVSKSYYKPTTKEVLEDYMKAIDLLTINTESRLSKQVEKLAEKDRESQYIIQAKLQEKDDALVTLSDQVMKLSNEIDLLKNKIRI